MNTIKTIRHDTKNVIEKSLRTCKLRDMGGLTWSIFDKQMFKVILHNNLQTKFMIENNP
jgi:hypothetical protein